MLEYFGSFFSGLSQIVTGSSDPSRPPVETDPVIVASITRIANDRIRTPTCLLRHDFNFNPREYYIDFCFSFESLISYIRSTMENPKEAWRVRSWDSTWSSVPNVGYLIELNELKSLSSKKFWFFNLSQEQVSYLDSLYVSYT